MVDPSTKAERHPQTERRVKQELEAQIETGCSPDASAAFYRGTQRRLWAVQTCRDLNQQTRTLQQELLAPRTRMPRTKWAARPRPTRDESMACPCERCVARSQDRHAPRPQTEQRRRRLGQREGRREPGQPANKVPEVRAARNSARLDQTSEKAQNQIDCPPGCTCTCREARVRHENRGVPPLDHWDATTTKTRRRGAGPPRAPLAHKHAGNGEPASDGRPGPWPGLRVFRSG